MLLNLLKLSSVLYRVLKWLQNSLIYSYHYNYEEVQVNIFPNANVSHDMDDVCAICTADSPFGSRAAQHNFQLSVVAVKSHPSVLDIRKSLSAPKPTLYRINDTGSYRPVDCASTSYILSTEGQVQVLSDSVQKVKWCPVMSEPHVLTLIKTHISQQYWYIIKPRLTVHAPASLLGKTTGRKSWYAKILTLTLRKLVLMSCSDGGVGTFIRPRHGYYESSQYLSLWTAPHQ
jgi:hypothetical protein